MKELLTSENVAIVALAVTNLFTAALFWKIIAWMRTIHKEEKQSGDRAWEHVDKVTDMLVELRVTVAKNSGD